MTIIILIFLVLFILFLLNKEHFEQVNEKLPKNIFTYITEDSPINYKNNIENLKLAIPDHWNLIIINEENLNQFVDEKFILKYQDLDAEKFMNLISLQVMLRQGGVWVDPRININDGSQFDRYQTESIYQGYDCCLLEFKDHKYTKYLKSYIIMATKDSNFLKKLFERLTKYYKMEVDDFIDDILPNNIKIKKKPTKDKEAKFYFYFSILLLLRDGYKYETLKRNEKNKIFYGIKITKTNKRDILNQQIQNYKFLNDLI